MNTLIRNRIFTHLMLWMGFVGMIVLLFFLQRGRIHFSLLEKIFSGAILFYINYLFLIPQLLFRKKILLYVLISLCVVVIFLFLPSFIEYFFMGRIPRGRLFRGRLFFFFFMQFFFFVAAIAIRLYEQWRENERKAQKILTEQIASELHYLKSQVNPHFLFNSLNSIYALTVKKSDQAPEAVITLSELMRYMLYETDTHFVSIEKELHYIKNYMKLQRLRMADSSGITMEIKGEVQNQKISPLLFISFIENAFKFGASSSGKTRVTIIFTLVEHSIHFHCHNTVGDNANKANNTEGIGLKNTKERLELLYPQKHTLQIEQSEQAYIVDLHLEL